MIYYPKNVWWVATINLSDFPIFIITGFTDIIIIYIMKIVEIVFNLLFVLFQYDRMKIVNLQM